NVGSSRELALGVGLGPEVEIIGPDLAHDRPDDLQASRHDIGTAQCLVVRQEVQSRAARVYSAEEDRAFDDQPHIPPMDLAGKVAVKVDEPLIVPGVAIEFEKGAIQQRE